MLDSDQLRLLTPDQRRELKDFEDLFSSAGWKQLQDRMSQTLAGLESFLRREAKEPYATGYARGTADALEQMVEAEKGIAAFYTAVVKEAEVAREEEAESRRANV